jgi:ice-binding like protein
MLRSRSVLSVALLLASGCGSSDPIGEPGEVTGDNGGSRGSGATGGDAAGGDSGSGGGNGQAEPNVGGAGGTEARAVSDAGATGDAGLGPLPVALGDAGNYAILAQSAISNVPTSAVTGALGLSPSAASYITGFTLTRAGDRWTSPEVLGGVFAADSDPTTPADLTAAVADMLAAYDDAANRPTPGYLNLADGAIGGRTLAPGLYRWTTSVTIPEDVVLSGGAEDRWIFQITGDLTVAAAARVNATGGALPENVVWQVAGEVDMGTTSHAEGTRISRSFKKS